MKLKPCPFCGSEAKIYHEDIGEGYSKENIRWNTVTCSSCYSEGKSDLSQNNSITNWNRRVYPPEVQAVLEAAKELDNTNLLKRVAINNAIIKLSEALRTLEAAEKEGRE